MLSSEWFWHHRNPQSSLCAIWTRPFGFDAWDQWQGLQASCLLNGLKKCAGFCQWRLFLRGPNKMRRPIHSCCYRSSSCLPSVPPHHGPYIQSSLWPSTNYPYALPFSGACLNRLPIAAFVSWGLHPAIKAIRKPSNSFQCNSTVA